jgi:hypothetical protein
MASATKSGRGSSKPSARPASAAGTSTIPAVASPYFHQTVAAALNAVKGGRPVVVIAFLENSQALAEAVAEAADRDGLAINVGLLDHGISLELAAPAE